MIANESRNNDLLSGLVFWGSEYFPGDLKLMLRDIRQWALKNKMIWDPEAQLIGEERLEELNKHFVPEDELFILIHLYKDEKDNLCYLEYPYLPVKTLIKKSTQIQIVYWRILPNSFYADGTPENYGELQFGFWYPNIIGEEFASMSNAKLVVKKFFDLYQALSGDYEKKLMVKGTLDITVDGSIKAKFFKTGRLFDVEIIQ